MSHFNVELRCIRHRYKPARYMFFELEFLWKSAQLKEKIF